MKLNQLARRNLRLRPGRAAALTLIVAFLTASIVGGTLIVSSLRGGLNSLEARLGADVIVIPGTAKSSINLKKTMLQDALGEYYMNRSYMNKIAKVEGVAQVTPQTYLVTMTTGCCDVSIQIIGFEPETDFIVWPWLSETYDKALEPCEIVVGDSVNLQVGQTIRFYDTPCKVVARLSRTGTSMDAGAYATTETLRILMEAGREKKATLMKAGDPEQVISAVYVKAAEGYDAESVAAKINIHVNRVKAEATRTMIASVADGLSGASKVILILVGVVWALALVILIVVFAMMVGERRREFAVLRALGASKGMLNKMLLCETGLVALLGAVLGAAVALIVVVPFAGLIGERLGLPILLPKALVIARTALAAMAASLAVCAVSALWAARRLGHVDVGAALREEK